MNVIHLVNDLKSKFYPEFFHSFHNSQINHIVLSTYTKSEYSNIDEFDGLSITIFHKYYRYKVMKLLNLFLLIKLVIKNRSTKTIIHCHNTNLEGLFAIIVSFIFKIDFIVTIRNTDINFTRTHWLTRGFFRLIIRRAIFVVLKTPAYIKYIPQEFASKIIVIPNGLNSFWINQLNLKQKKFGGEAEEYTVILVADFYCNKNIDIAINSVSELNKDGYRIKLRIAGRLKGDCINGYLELIERNRSVVEYVGELSDKELIAFYNSGDIFCLCSKYETFGLVYIEALSQGLPVIYSRGQGIDGWLEDGFGIPIEPSIANLSKALELFLLGKWVFTAPDEKYFDRFNWLNIGLEFEKIYLKK